MGSLGLSGHTGARDTLTCVSPRDTHHVVYYQPPGKRRGHRSQSDGFTLEIAAVWDSLEFPEAAGRPGTNSITPPVSTDSLPSWTYTGGNSWSPDGEWIVSSTLGRLQVVNVKTGLTMPLPWSYDYSAPDWKPR